MKVKIKVPKMIPRKLLHIAHTLKYGNTKNEIIDMNPEAWNDESKKYISVNMAGKFLGMVPREWFSIVAEEEMRENGLTDSDEMKVINVMSHSILSSTSLNRVGETTAKRIIVKLNENGFRILNKIKK